MSGEESSPRTAVGDLCASGKESGPQSVVEVLASRRAVQATRDEPAERGRMKKQPKKLQVCRETLADLSLRAALGGTAVVPDREVATLYECPDLKAERVQES